MPKCTGRASDNSASIQQVELPAGALRIADLGYFALEQLATMTEHGVDVLSRFSPQVAIYDREGRRCDLLELLERDAVPTLDLAVTIGAKQRIPVRLLALRVPQEVADQRRRRLREAHRAKGKVPNARTLALLAWTIAITTVPVERLSLAEALVLFRARWQIEVLFKVWKSQGQVDSWRSQQPWRILCEVYAKLLGMLVMHWVVVVSSWSYPNRSLMKAAQTVQGHAYALASAVRESRDRIVTALATIQRCLSVGGRINRRRTKPNTYQLLGATPLLR